jgi:isopentenyl-diphosphate delta-isomerase
MENRKKDHINLAFESQTSAFEMDSRFVYEPMLGNHSITYPKVDFAGKNQDLPIWVSSMTGGTKMAKHINENLARACAEFGMGMGLGSCRIILDDDTYFNDFNVRSIIGDYPLWANLGIAQIDELLKTKSVDKASNLVHKLDADGLIIHVNPMQEWFQPEGDIINRSALEIIQEFIEEFEGKIIVKEVGQGMGPESLKLLLNLDIEAIEFAAFGGTNFAKVELLRNPDKDFELLEPLSRVGNTAYEMIDWINELDESQFKCKQLIVSGGIKTFLDGYYFLKKSKMPAIYGMASQFLKYAKNDYSELKKFVEYQKRGLDMAYAFLSLNRSNSH